MAYTQLPTNLLKLHFEDDAGKRASSQYHVATSEHDPLAGGCLAITNAAKGLSADALTTNELIIGATNDSPGDPTDGPYARGADKLKLAFRTTSGQDVQLNIGSPKETTLKTGNVYVDPAQADVANLITVMAANATDENGQAVLGLQRGYRNRPPRRKHA